MQMLIFTIIFLEFVGYLFVRQCVNVIEFFAGCASTLVPLGRDSP